MAVGKPLKDALPPPSGKQCKLHLPPSVKIRHRYLRYTSFPMGLLFLCCGFCICVVTFGFDMTPLGHRMSTMENRPLFHSLCATMMRLGTEKWYRLILCE
ncbi:hypothetical protein ATANTOWER_026245 [Ataeniobius toweri]|uniref:Uncharacterized protein n=1 Tax=Ataeniobius toweri TaxID=208326 RepID=A0ABU7BRZ6_9TELE|nr:hypothetical protein [Ataeniobius toweri]